MIHHTEGLDGDSEVQQYMQQGGQMTDPSSFGSDPIGDDLSLRDREERWLRDDLNLNVY